MRVQRVTSKTGVKMVIVQTASNAYDVFTADEYAYGKGYRTAEYEDSSLEEALSQAKHY